MAIKEYRDYIEHYEIKNKDFIDLVIKKWNIPLSTYQKVYLDFLIEKSKRGSDKN